jgi:hypothetical protein
MHPPSQCCGALRLNVGTTWRAAAAACWIGSAGPALAGGGPQGLNNRAWKRLLLANQVHHFVTLRANHRLRGVDK